MDANPAFADHMIQLMKDGTLTGMASRAGAPPAVKRAATQSEKPAPVGVNLNPQSDDGWQRPEPVTLADGTRIQLFKDGEALLAAYNAIKEAQRRVCLEVYIFSSDETGRAFAELLGEKARQGVAVYLIYDSFGSIDSDRDMFRRMKRQGVRLRQFHPIRPWECKFGWRPINRDHRKLLIVDQDLAGLGGLNVGGEYAGSWVIKSSRQSAMKSWRDNAIGVVGPGADLFFQAYRNTWKYIERGGRIGRAAYVHDPFSAELGVMATVPTINSPLRPFLMRLLREARRSILLTMAYFAPDDPLVAELCNAARRGVRVRLMLPGKSDVRILHIAAQSFYETLMDAGVEVYERQGVVLHTKALVIDERTTVIGSTNLDYRSIEYNLELSAIVHSAELGRQMCDLFENDVGFAIKMECDEWRHRPWLDRVGQWAVSRARYLL